MSEFTINPYGELSSSLTFVYTSQWVWVYTIMRISNNIMITDEIDILDGDTLLFYVNGSTVIDESDSFYGVSNNGRNCIIKADSYEYDVTACIFQNDLVGYNANDYFQGLIQTSGIARYVDKFTFNVSANELQFTLHPIENADFDFYIETDGTVCPRLLNSQSNAAGCIFTFFFTGVGTPMFTGSNGPEPLVCSKANNYTYTINAEFGVYSVNIGSPAQSCFVVNCLYSASYSTVLLDPPDYTVISASDLALQSQIDLAIDSAANGTLSNLQNVVDMGQSLGKSYLNLSSQLAKLNFSVQNLVPYQNFTDLRNQVEAAINNITSNPVGFNLAGLFDGSGCSGIFGGIECFFQNLGNTLLTIAIIAAVVVGAYCVCCKMGVAKMVTKKVFG